MSIASEKNSSVRSIYTFTDFCGIAFGYIAYAMTKAKCATIRRDQRGTETLTLALT